LGITTGCDPYINIDPFGFTRQHSNKGTGVFLTDISPKPFPAQNLAELGKGRKGEQKLSLL